MNDILIEKLINQEKERQLNGIELIASENYVSNDVYEALDELMYSQMISAETFRELDESVKSPLLDILYKLENKRK